MWAHIFTLGTYKLYFAGSKAGKVGFMGVVEENGDPQILALRLKIENRKMAELEAIVARSGGGLRGRRILVDKPIFHESLAANDHPVAAKNSCALPTPTWKAWKSHRQITPFDPQCTRMENGALAANNPASSMKSAA